MTLAPRLRTLSEADATNASPGVGWLAIPASNAALTVPVRSIIVVTAGNLAVVLADGSSNAASPIAVTAGQIFPLQVISLAASGNTAVILGII